MLEDVQSLLFHVVYLFLNLPSTVSRILRDSKEVKEDPNKMLEVSHHQSNMRQSL